MATYKKIKVDYSGLEKYKKELFDAAVKNKTEYLIKYAKETLKKAYDESEYTDREKNLADSYVWIVYFNGKEEKHGFLYDSPQSNQPNRKTATNEYERGRDVAEEFVREYIPRISNGWEVVLAATIYYGNYLEMGTSRNKQYVVLSSIFNEVEQDFGKQNTQIFKNVYKY